MLSFHVSVAMLTTFVYTVVCTVINDATGRSSFMRDVRDPACLNGVPTALFVWVKCGISPFEFYRHSGTRTRQTTSLPFTDKYRVQLL